MTKYLTEERFIVHSNTKEAQRNYRDGWERTFGENTEDPGDAPLPRPCTGFYDDGVMPTACQNREGCGLIGCPAADFGNTYDNPSVPPPALEDDFTSWCGHPRGSDQCHDCLPCGGCDEEPCECEAHDPDCEKLCTQGACCNCGRAPRL